MITECGPGSRPPTARSEASPDGAGHRAASSPCSRPSCSASSGGLYDVCQPKPGLFQTALQPASCSSDEVGLLPEPGPGEVPGGPPRTGRCGGSAARRESRPTWRSPRRRARTSWRQCGASGSGRTSNHRLAVVRLPSLAEGRVGNPPPRPALPRAAKSQAYAALEGLMAAVATDTILVSAAAAQLWSAGSNSCPSAPSSARCKPRPPRAIHRASSVGSVAARQVPVVPPPWRLGDEKSVTTSLGTPGCHRCQGFH